MNAGSVGAFFDEKWHLYQRAIRAGLLCHDEMFGALDRLLQERFADRPFRFADLGCGDATAVSSTLRGKPVSHYIGVDAGSDLIDSAARTIAFLNCEKTFLCADMAKAIKEIPSPVDLILCSYSLHHLSFKEKTQFIHDCFHVLIPSGCLVVVDGFLMPNETRDEWLNRLERRIREKVPDFGEHHVAQLMQHPRDSDYPETIESYRQLAQKTGWSDFQVLVYKDDFLALILFSR